MWKLFENFHIFYFQKRIVSSETIRGNTVFAKKFEDRGHKWQSNDAFLVVNHYVCRYGLGGWYEKCGKNANVVYDRPSVLTLIGMRVDTFISLSFLNQILSSDFLSKLSKLF